MTTNNSLNGKSADTEEWFDTVFTRPIGFQFARFYAWVHATPNFVTWMSMILNVIGALFLLFDADNLHGFLMNLLGVVLITIGNFHDSADGQLARMTGQCSPMGRIFDGMASDVSYIAIYFVLFFRMFHHLIPGTSVEWGWIGFLLLVFDGLVCHVCQCRLSDYYRNMHLFMLSDKPLSLRDTYVQQKAYYDSLTWKDNPAQKFCQFWYVPYMKAQEAETPHLQAMLRRMHDQFGDNPPREVREQYRLCSLPMMKWTNLQTYNLRAAALFVACLIDQPWLCPVFEIVVLSAFYWWMRYHHERFCKTLFC